MAAATLFSSIIPHTLVILFALLTLSQTQVSGLFLTVVNHCPFTVWPAIQPNSGHPVLARGGFVLETNTHRSFDAPTSHWSGRIWARTGCTNSNNHFTCATGDCGGRLECDGAGGAPPASLAQFTLHHGGSADYSSYGVSLVDGYNVPMTVTPHEGKGNCPVVGCKADLIPTCPASLQFHGPGGHVMGCKSGCEAFGTDQLCCRNKYNSPEECKANSYTDFFKKSCPDTFTFAHDNPSVMHQCSAPRELKVIFCHPL